MRSPGLIVAGCLMLLLTGCGWWPFARVDLPVAPPPIEQPTSRADDTSLDVSERLKAAREDLAAAEARVASLTESVRAERDEQFSRQLIWVFLLCLVGLGACIAAAIWLPVGKKTAAAGAGAFASVAVLALCVRSIIPYLPWVGLGLLAVGGIAAVVVLHPHLWTLRTLAARVDLDAAPTDKAKRVLLCHRQALAAASTERFTKS